MEKLFCSCGGIDEHDTPRSQWICRFRDILRLEFSYIDYGNPAPPFTSRQIFTMAVLSHPEKRAPSCLVPWCLGSVFPGFYQRASFSWIPVISLGVIYAQLVDELKLFDSPLYIHDDGQITLRSGGEDEGLYHTHDTRKIQFLDFPPELRLEVYRHILVFTADKDARMIQPSLHSKFMTGYTATFMVTINGIQNCVISPRQVLALLCTNRQLNVEAKPVFYGENRFRFPSVAHLDSFLSGIGQKRRQHLRSVSFSYPIFGSMKREKALVDSALLFLYEANLQCLHLDMNEERCFVISRPKIQSVQQIPGLWLLRKFRGLKEVTFGGASYERAEKFLKHEMLKPKGDRGERALLKRKR